MKLSDERWLRTMQVCVFLMGIGAVVLILSSIVAALMDKASGAWACLISGLVWALAYDRCLRALNAALEREKGTDNGKAE